MDEEQGSQPNQVNQQLESIETELRIIKEQLQKIETNTAISSFVMGIIGIIIFIGLIS